MQRSAHGFWLADAGPVVARPALGASASADVLVIGGGYLGMWTAWYLARAGADVLLVEREVCGHGPSGRNGGFVESLWHGLDTLRSLFGDARALELARAAATALDGIASFLDAEGVDADFVRAGRLDLAAAPGQEAAARAGIGAARELGVGDEVTELDAAGVRALCDSPVFRGGALWKTAATVHP